MSSPENVIQITPFMYVVDLDATLRFFEDILGFETPFRTEGYAYIRRGPAGIRIMESDEAVRGHRQFAYYLDVRDVDAIYAELKPKLDTLPVGDVHGPADKPYGQRELLVLAPDGNLVAFGQEIAQSPGQQRPLA